MKRDYKDKNNSNQKVVYFVGQEIEKTNQYKVQTLFVAGPRPYDEIIKWHKIAEERTKQKIRHIFATANMSLKFWQHTDTETVKRLLKKFYVTIDGAPRDILRLLPHLPKSKKITVMISLEVPHVEELKKFNCVLKIDDTGFSETNPGVWCHRLGTLTGTRGFTAWALYKNDVIIATENDIKFS